MKYIQFMLFLFAAITLTGCVDSGNGNEGDIESNNYTISFETNGGASVEMIQVERGASLSSLLITEKEGYLFLGWYTGESINDTQFTVLSVVTRDMVLYAKWEINQYTISFDTHKGYWMSPITQDYGTEVFEPSHPYREGYEFEGWFLDEELTISYDFSTMDSKDITVFTKWRVNQYSITYKQYETNDLMNPIPLNVGENITQVELSWSHTLALTTNGRLFVWGSTITGIGSKEYIYTPHEVTEYFSLDQEELITNIYSNTFAITSTGRIFAWGSNNGYRLGDGTDDDSNRPIDITNQFDLIEDEYVTKMSSGRNHSIALTSLGRVFIWGSNYCGQLGIGSNTVQMTPLDITYVFNLSDGEEIIQVTTGSDDTAVLTSLGRMFIWGDNEDYQLGDGTDIDKDTPVDITDEFGLGIDEKIVQISLSGYHSSAVTSSGRVFLWGRNQYGRLGDNTTIPKEIPNEITNNFSLNSSEKIIYVILGPEHSSAITNQGRLLMWGRNCFGQLGDLTQVDKLVPEDVTSNFNLGDQNTIVALSLGGRSSSAITSNGDLYMWGYNNDYQLGDGTTASIIKPQMLPFIEALTEETIYYDYGKTLELDVPVREGYTFDGWYTDSTFEQSFSFTTMPAEDLILYAKWLKND